MYSYVSLRMYVYVATVSYYYCIVGNIAHASVGRIALVMALTAASGGLTSTIVSGFVQVAVYVCM